MNFLLMNLRNKAYEISQFQLESRVYKQINFIQQWIFDIY